MAGEDRKGAGGRDDVRLTRYEYFVAVADCGGFSAAARELGCSQSSVSRQVAALEAEVGFSLVQRTRRSSKVGLTPAGEALLSRARAVCATIAAFDESAHALGKSSVKTLVLLSAIGGFPQWLVDALADIRPAFSDVRLRMWTIDSTVAQSAIVDDRADVAIVRNPTRGGMVKRLLAEDALVVVGPPELVGPEGKPCPLGRIAGSELYVAEDAASELDEMERVSGTQVRPTVLSQDAGALVRLAGTGRGCAVVWRSALVPVRGGLRVASLEGAPTRYVCALVSASGGGTLPAEFASALVESVRPHGGRA